MRQLDSGKAFRIPMDSLQELPLETVQGVPARVGRVTCV